MKVLSMVLLASVLSMPVASLAGAISASATNPGGSACGLTPSSEKGANINDAKLQPAPAIRPGTDSKAIAVDTSADGQNV